MSFENSPPSYQSSEINNEVVIAVMGITGAGKSYFIREVSGIENVVVGDDLESCTSEIVGWRFPYTGKTVTLVDTPGFNNTYRSDTDILRDISNCLGNSYTNGALLSRVIFLHPISDTRMEGSSLRNLRMFRKLCGDDAMKKVFLTTTQWSNVDEATGKKREEGLRSNEKFYGSLVKKGTKIERFSGDRDSGLKLSNRLMKGEKVKCDIQRELVDEKKTLEQTAAGSVVSEHLAKLQKKYEGEMEELKQ